MKVNFAGFALSVIIAVSAIHPFSTASAASNDLAPVSLQNCSLKELSAYNLIHSISYGAEHHAQISEYRKEIETFIRGKNIKDESKPLASQLSKEDNLTLDRMLTRFNSYNTRSKIEEVRFRDLDIILKMMVIVQNDDINNILASSKNTKLSAQLISIGLVWNKEKGSPGKPFYIVDDDKNCNVFTLAQQLQLEAMDRIGADPEEIQRLNAQVERLIKIAGPNREHIDQLSPDERRVFNRAADVYRKLSSFQFQNDMLEKLKAIAYVAELKYRASVKDWETYLGDVSKMRTTLEKEVFADPKNGADFRVIYKYISTFEKNFPFEKYYENAISSGP